jgi:HK97 family phage prohead protease
MMRIEHKYISLSNFKSVDEGPGSLEGYVSVFRTIDEGGDLLLPGCYKSALPEFLSSGFSAESHDWSMSGMIGFPSSAKDDGYGLFVKTIFHSTSDAQNVRQKVSERLAAGKSVGLSIGYLAGTPIFIQPKDYRSQLPKYLSSEFLEEDMAKAANFPRIRVLPQILELKECSVVTSPMNRRAVVAGVKSQRPGRAFSRADNSSRQGDPSLRIPFLIEMERHKRAMKAQLAREMMRALRRRIESNLRSLPRHKRTL